jgi:hypothetical protein
MLQGLHLLKEAIEATFKFCVGDGDEPLDEAEA